MDLDQIGAMTEGVRGEVRKVVIGQDGVVDIARKLISRNQDAALSRAALDLHQWKQEILRGP